MVDADSETLHAMSEEQRLGMLRALLADRFGLKVHAETKVLAVFELVVAKSGVKFSATPVAAAGEDKNAKFHDVGRGGISINNSHLTAHDIEMPRFANTLSYQVHRTVIDKTALAGKYDFTLEWTPDDRTAADIDAAPPSIFTALQEQMGLKLQAAKGPVETLVVDSVMPPTEN